MGQMKQKKALYLISLFIYITLLFQILFLDPFIFSLFR